MSQDHHHLPQVYLRQWCDKANDQLVRYRRVGPSMGLNCKRRAPSAIGYETDLNTLPAGCAANGLRGNDVEAVLARNVDDRLGTIVSSALKHHQRVDDARIARDLLGLLRVFIARTPRTMTRAQVAATDFLNSERDTIQRLVGRALPGGKAHEALRALLNDRAPRAVMLATVAGVAQGALPKDWLDGDLHVVHASDVRDELDEIGAQEFITFDNPVVEWEPPEWGLLASFSLSPETLLLVVRCGAQPTLADYRGVARRHALDGIVDREVLISRTEVRRPLLERAARSLRPITAERQAEMTKGGIRRRKSRSR